MKRFFILIAALVLIAATTLPLFAEEPEYSTDYDWKRFYGKNMSVNVYNWGEYISVDDGEGALDVNKEFEKLTGIKVNYTNFATNEELYAKLKSGGASYDVIIPSDYMIARLITEGMLEKLNFDNIPNFRYIYDEYKNQDYDPTNEYSVPYTWGTVGIVYNTTLVDPEDDVASWDILWNEKYANNILMFSNSRDAITISLFRLGYSINTTNEDELREAAEELKKQKPLVQAYVMDEIFDKMGGGEAAIAPYYAGDAIVMIGDNPDLAFVHPKDGTNWFTDAMCIPSGAKNKEAAEMYINFMCETAIATANCEFIGYSTPQYLAYEALDAEIRESEIAYPADEVIEKTQVMIEWPTNVTRLVDSLWTELMSETGVNPWVVPIMMVGALALSAGLSFYRHKKKNQKYFEQNGITK